MDRIWFGTPLETQGSPHYQSLANSASGRNTGDDDAVSSAGDEPPNDQHSNTPERPSPNTHSTETVASKPSTSLPNAQNTAEKNAEAPNREAENAAAQASTSMQSAQTAEYWRTFSKSIERKVLDRLDEASIENASINPKSAAQPYFRDAPVNSSGALCVRNPKHELKLSVAQADGTNAPLYLHGHEAVFTEVSQDSAVGAAQESRLALAQSPDKPADTAISGFKAPSTLSEAPPPNTQQARSNPGHEWLLFALQSNRSELMQFVSRISHRDGSNGQEVPLLKQLEDALASGPVKLDNQHTITKIELSKADWVNNSVGRKVANITVEVEKDGVKSEQEIRLTQVAPPFEKRLLKAPDLHTVYSISQQQKQNLDQTVMFSYAGMGRNATLAVYDQVMKAIEKDAITSVEQLDESIKTLVESGRSIHHKNFVHSDDQLAEVFTAAYRQLLERHPEAAEKQAPSNGNRGLIGADARASSAKPDAPASEDLQTAEDVQVVEQLVRQMLANVIALASAQPENDNDAVQDAPSSNHSSRRSSWLSTATDAPRSAPTELNLDPFRLLRRLSLSSLDTSRDDPYRRVTFSGYPPNALNGQLEPPFAPANTRRVSSGNLSDLSEILLESVLPGSNPAHKIPQPPTSKSSIDAGENAPAPISSQNSLPGMSMTQNMDFVEFNDELASYPPSRRQSESGNQHQ